MGRAHCEAVVLAAQFLPQADAGVRRVHIAEIADHHLWRLSSNPVLTKAVTTQIELEPGRLELEWSSNKVG